MSNPGLRTFVQLASLNKNFTKKPLKPSNVSSDSESMKNQSLLIAFIVSILMALPFVSGCAKKSDPAAATTTSNGGGGGGGGGGSSKGMINQWDCNSIWFIDFTSGNLSGTPFTATVVQNTGEVCLYDVELNGDDTTGTCTIVNPGSYVPGTGSGDPGCSTNNQMNLCGLGGPATGTGGYSDSGTTLTFPNNGISCN